MTLTPVSIAAVDPDWDKVTQKLFSTYPRDFGNPTRIPVYNFYSLKQKITQYNGVTDCYVSVYSTPRYGDPYSVDRLFFDLDGDRLNLDKVLEASRLLYDTLTSFGIPVVPIATGKKGLQLHAMLVPTPSDSETLRLVTHALLKYTFKDNPALLNYIDTHPIGDLKRICRIPNTLRPPDNKYCSSYLPTLNRVTEYTLLEHTRLPQIYDYDFTTKTRLTDIALEFDYEDLPEQSFTPLTLPTDTDEIPIELLRLLIRPCLYRNILLKEPPHPARVATTIDLLNQGFTVASINNLYCRLGWVDYDPQITLQQIRGLLNPDGKPRLYPYSCKRLRQLKIPKACCVG